MVFIESNIFNTPSYGYRNSQYQHSGERGIKYNIRHVTIILSLFLKYEQYRVSTELNKSKFGVLIFEILTF